MYSIYHAFVARWDHSASSFSPTSPPSLSAPPSLPLFTVGRATSRASTRRGRGGRNNPPGNILSLFHVLPAYFSSRNLSLPFRSSSPLPFLFLLFFFFFFLPFPSSSKSSFDGVARGRMILRCFEGGTMKILIDGDCGSRRIIERERNNNNERPIDFVSNKNFIDQGTSVKF